jgi:hypothetical protein
VSYDWLHVGVRVRWRSTATRWLYGTVVELDTNTTAAVRPDGGGDLLYLDAGQLRMAFE